MNCTYCTKTAVSHGLCDLHRGRRTHGIAMDKPMYAHSSRLAKATDEQIAEKYREIRSIKKVAAATGISRNTIQQALVRLNVPMRMRGRPRGDRFQSDAGLTPPGEQPRRGE